MSTPVGAGRRVAVVGAGIVGTSIALALRKRGADVTLIDRDEPGRGCSFGNSGAISPASVAPLAMPGILSSLPAMLLDPEGPLVVRLRHLPRSLPWLLRFLHSARPAAVQRAATRLAALHQGALDAHRAMAHELGVPELFLQCGHLHLYPDAAALAKDAAGWRLRESFGYRGQTLDRDGIEALEPRVKARYQVGVFLADHATILNPHRYVQAMARACAAAGARLLRADVRRLERRGRRWLVPGTLGPVDDFDDVVVAAGAWSGRLLAPLGIRLALESQRGYHLQFAGGRDVVSRTVVLADRKIFVTPMEEGLRVGGTVEIAGLQAPPDPGRAAMLGRLARESFDGLDELAATTWMGHRPCMPDSVPVVGPAPGAPGLWIATGHGHLGLTDSLNTAQWITEAMLAGRSTPDLAGELVRA